MVKSVPPPSSYKSTTAGGTRAAAPLQWGSRGAYGPVSRAPGAGAASVTQAVREQVKDRDFADNNGLSDRPRGKRVTTCPGMGEGHPPCGVELREEENNFQVMHRVPVAKGGQNVPENLFLGCAHCNHRMACRTSSEVLREEPAVPAPRKYYFERGGRPVRTTAAAADLTGMVFAVLRARCARCARDASNVTSVPLRPPSSAGFGGSLGGLWGGVCAAWAPSSSARWAARPSPTPWQPGTPCTTSPPCTRPGATWVSSARQRCRRTRSWS